MSVSLLIYGDFHHITTISSSGGGGEENDSLMSEARLAGLVGDAGNEALTREEPLHGFVLRLALNGRNEKQPNLLFLNKAKTFRVWKLRGSRMFEEPERPTLLFSLFLSQRKKCEMKMKCSGRNISRIDQTSGATGKPERSPGGRASQTACASFFPSVFISSHWL